MLNSLAQQLPSLADANCGVTVLNRTVINNCRYENIPRLRSQSIFGAQSSRVNI